MTFTSFLKIRQQSQSHNFYHCFNFHEWLTVHITRLIIYDYKLSVSEKKNRLKTYNIFLTISILVWHRKSSDRPCGAMDSASDF